MFASEACNSSYDGADRQRLEPRQSTLPIQRLRRAAPLHESRLLQSRRQRESQGPPQRSSRSCPMPRGRSSRERRWTWGWRRGAPDSEPRGLRGSIASPRRMRNLKPSGSTANSCTAWARLVIHSPAHTDGGVVIGIPRHSHRGTDGVPITQRGRKWGFQWELAGAALVHTPYFATYMNKVALCHSRYCRQWSQTTATLTGSMHAGKHEALR